jgi:hypothetical protein
VQALAKASLPMAPITGKTARIYGGMDGDGAYEIVTLAGLHFIAFLPGNAQLLHLAQEGGLVDPEGPAVFTR